MTTKTCVACKKDLPLTRFRADPRMTDSDAVYYRSRCTSCQTAYDKERYAHKRHPRKLRTIKCIQCRVNQPRKKYTSHRLRQSPGTTKCLDCEPKVVPMSRRFEPGKLYPCRQCHKVLPSDQFTVQKVQDKRYVYSNCRSCVRVYDAQLRRKKLEAAGISCSSWQEARQLKQDARYDFAFARDILGFTTEEATAWIARGYCKSDWLVSGWAFDSEEGLEWQPDPITI